MRKIWALLMALCVLLTLPGAFHKHQLETSSQTVEMTVGFDSILSVSNSAEKSTKTLKQTLKELKKMDVTSISVPFNSFYTLEQRGMVSVLNGKQLKAKQFGSTDAFTVDPESQYVLVLNTKYNKEINKIMKSSFTKKEVSKHQLNDATYYEVKSSSADLYKKRFQPLDSDIALLKSYGFNLITLVPNLTKDNQDMALDVIKDWKKDGVLSKVMFDGPEVLGYPNNLSTFMPLWKKQPFVYQEIFAPNPQQKGIQTLLRDSNYNAVRTHILSAAELMSPNNSVPVLEERLTKAIDERNMRMMYFELSPSATNNPFESVTKLQDVVDKTTAHLKEKGYHFGVAKPFSTEHSVWQTISKGSFVVLTGLVFAYLMSLFFPMRYAWVSLVASYVVMGATAIAASRYLWILLPLTFAILVPILVGSLLYRTFEKRNVGLIQSVVLFIISSVATLFSAIALTSTFASTEYILYVEQFHGVAIAHLIPIVALFLLMFCSLGKLPFSLLWNFVRQPIKVYHVILVVFVGALGMYYLSRTGNGGTMLPFEAQFREFLQHSLGVRPRTKEFLFAHPLLIVILVYWKRHAFVKWLLPIAVIGQISIMNTFTHLHTPVFISATRALIGIGLGTVVGLIAVAIIHIVIKVLKKINDKFQLMNYIKS